jgi:hypothetical protein
MKERIAKSSGEKKRKKKKSEATKAYNLQQNKQSKHCLSQKQSGAQ